MTKQNTKHYLALGACALIATGLTGCGASSNAADSSAGASTSAAAGDMDMSSGSDMSMNAAPATGSAAADHAAHGITVSNQWVKAEKSMTSLFGTVQNTTDQPRTIVKATSDAAGMVQLHETVSNGSGGMTMKEKKDGFALPAHGSKTLEPGGDHVMLMDLHHALKAGDTVKVTLTLDDGSTVAVSAPVKEFAGAQESYAPSSK